MPSDGTEIPLDNIKWCLVDSEGTVYTREYRNDFELVLPNDEYAVFMEAPHEDPDYPGPPYRKVDIIVNSEHAEITGRVVCCEGDEIAEFGINEATITINALNTQCQTSSFVTTSGTLGWYELEIPLIASTYQITVEKEG